MARKRARRNRRAQRTLARALIFALAALVALALGAIAWLVIVYPKRLGPGRGREIVVQVSPSMDLSRLAHRLHDAGAIESPFLFASYARLLGASDHLRSGSVRITDDMTPGDVLSAVAVGLGTPTVRVTIPEGFHRYDIALRLERLGICGADELVRASEDPALLAELGVRAPSAEGYLFPDTYRFPQALGGAEVLRRLVANHRRRVDPVLASERDALATLDRDLGFGAHQALILASIVEKEAAVSEERPVIARVFLNRLHMPGFSPRRLQADPTVSYGYRAAPSRAVSCQRFDGRTITRAMLADRDNPYNTYRIEGLPPGPICNPGLDSIRAVLVAEPHDYLYFVARGGGRHAFSATLDEHNAAVARLRERAP